MKKLLGEYIIFIDSDDYIEPNMLDKLYTSAKRNNSDLVICDYYEIYNSKKLFTKAMTKYSDNMINNYILANASPWNKLIKTSILKENNIKFLEKHIYEDLATMPILAGYIKTITYVEEPLYDYIIHPGSSMRQSTYNKKLDSIFVAINHLENEFKNRNLIEKYQEEIEFLNIYHLLYAASGRFLEYPEGKEKLKNITKILKNNYPNWEKNKYYKKQNLQIKLTCKIFFSNNFTLINSYNITRKVFKQRK